MNSDIDVYTVYLSGDPNHVNCIPVSKENTVQRGPPISRIAKALGMDVETLRNALDQKKVIRARYANGQWSAV